MMIFDAVLIIILASFVLYGLFYGLIKTIGSLVGVVAGAYLASRLYLIVFELVRSLFFGYNNLGKILTFLILFAIINRLVCFLFSILHKTYNIIAIIPFLKTINRLAGGFLGFLEGGIVVGLALYVIANNFLIGGWFENMVENSRIAPSLIKFIEILKPLLPGMLEKLKELV
ncbi:MAG: CvpA family protein [Candidatus Falkowbacteria bacterium]